VTAIGFVRRIKSRCERIGIVPMGGVARDDLQPGLRIVPFEHSAVIAYVIEDDQVCITNVFYGGRDYEALYRGTEPAQTDEDE
jgi:toxin ParE1/3/4